MPFTVRVTNFQSIKDATVVVDGFTVVTGPNNSGKTALQRAIRGVFTNAPAGPLVRHGEAHLTVEITFDDGQTVKWEKGWKKPGQKGATINRYTVNGKVLPKVGRGAPPEVLALGIRPIKAGDRTLWPQVADQFSGVLFLVDTPGSVVAEAIADVDRVGKLSTALKLSESDRRKTADRLNLRREDEGRFDLEMAQFEGLDRVGKQVAGLQEGLREAEETRGEVETLSGLRDRHDRSSAVRRRLSGIREVQLSKQKRVDKTVRTGAALRGLVDLHGRLSMAQGEASRLAPVSTITVPERASVTTASQVQTELGEATWLQNRLTLARQSREELSVACQELEGHTFEDNAPKTAEKTRGAVQFFTHQIRLRLTMAREGHADLVTELAEAEREAREVQEEVTELLGDMGECPVCGTPMDVAHLGVHA